MANVQDSRQPRALQAGQERGFEFEPHQGAGVHRRGRYHLDDDILSVGEIRGPIRRESRHRRSGIGAGESASQRCALRAQRLLLGLEIR